MTTDRTGIKVYLQRQSTSISGTSAATRSWQALRHSCKSDMKAGIAVEACQLKNRIQDTAINLGAADFNDFYGHGRVNACRALKQTLSITRCEDDSGRRRSQLSRPATTSLWLISAKSSPASRAARAGDRRSSCRDR